MIDRELAGEAKTKNDLSNERIYCEIYTTVTELQAVQRRG